MSLYNNMAIPMQRELAKRLAQCSATTDCHPALKESYNEIIKREVMIMRQEEKRNQDAKFERKSSVAIFLSGLFSFYQHAGFEVKMTLLDMFRDEFLLLQKELILSLPGFMLCLLPELQTTNGEIRTLVEQILKLTEKIVGTSEFYGELWKAMLRTPNVRLSVIKYLSRHIPRTLEEAQILNEKKEIHLSNFTIRIIDSQVQLKKDEERKKSELEIQDRGRNMSLHDYFYFYYPNKDKLVINALIVGLQTTKFNAAGTILRQNQQVQRQYNRATLDFLISHMRMESEINSIDENVLLGEHVTLLYTGGDLACINNINEWLIPTQLDDLDEDDIEDMTYMRKHICVRTIVEAMKKHFKNNPQDSISLLLKIDNDYTDVTPAILRSLAVELLQFIQTLNMESNSKEIIGLLQQIKKYYFHILEALEEVFQAENMLAQSLDNLTYAIFELPNFFYGVKSQSLIDETSQQGIAKILFKLLQNVSKFQDQNQSTDESLQQEHALNLINKILDIIHLKDLIIVDQLVNEIGNEEIESLRFNQKKLQKKAIESFNEVYVQKTEHFIQNQDVIADLDNFKLFNQIINKIFPIQSLEEDIPKWLQTLIKHSKDENAKYCLVSSRIFIDIYKKEKEINVTGIKTHIYGQEQSHCKEIIKNLWSMLVDVQSETQNIVKVLKDFDELVPQTFSKVVIEDLKEEEKKAEECDFDINISGSLQQEKDLNDAIKKFTTFWQFTGAAVYQQENEKYMPFKTEIDGRKYTALHNMILFLEHPDPTLRLSCRSWLSQCGQSRQFNRILDPIIEELQENRKFEFEEQFNLRNSFSGDQNQMIKKYTQHVIENFGKLRNIILNTQEDMIDFIIKGKPRLSTASKSMIEKQQDDVKQDIEPQKEDTCYIDIITDITLFFIQAKIVQEEPMTNTFFQKHDHNQFLQVNTSACEFMELILKQSSKQDKEINKIAHKIIGPLIENLLEVIEREDHAMEVNIINLVDLILNHCNFQFNASGQPNDEQKKKCAEIFENPNLFSAIQLGLHCEVSYIRSKFIKFVEMLVPYLKKFAADYNINQFMNYFYVQIDELIKTFCYLLRCVDISQFSQKRAKANQNKGKNYSETLSKMELDTFTKNNRSASIFNRQQSSKVTASMQKPRPQREEEEKLIINQETDICRLIDGLKCIIVTCLGLKNLSQGQDYAMEEDQDGRIDLQNQEKKQNGLFNRFIGGVDGFNNQLDEMQGRKDAYKRQIHNRMTDILISCIYCWNDCDLYDWKNYNFSRKGIFPFYEQDNQLMTAKLTRDGTSFQENLKKYQNNIQKSIVQMLGPYAQKYYQEFLQKTLDIWLDTDLLVNFKHENNELHKNARLLKLIQILISLYDVKFDRNRFKYTLPIHQIIDQISQYNEDFQKNKGAKQPSLVRVDRWKKKEQWLSVEEATSETLLNSFLYTYLLYNPTMAIKYSKKMQEERENQQKKIYNSILKYVQLFKNSKNPFTLCWLLEILNIVSNKIPLKLDKATRKDFQTMLDIQLKKVSRIMSEILEQPRINFYKEQEYRLSLPPTIYEFLFRYEYIQFKNDVFFREQHDQQFQGRLFQMFKKSFIGKPPKDSKIQKMVDQMISKKEPILFDFQYLKTHADNELEQFNDNSIFKNMHVLSKDCLELEQDNNLKDQTFFMMNIWYSLNHTYRNPKRHRSQQTAENQEYTTKANQDMKRQTQIFCIITLKQVFYNLIHKLVGLDEGEKTHRSIHNILPTTIQLLPISKRKEMKVLNEFIIDFFASFVSQLKKPNLIKPYKAEIYQLFNKDDFFQYDLLSFRQWQIIIKTFIDIDGKPDEIFGDQMSKWQINQGGFFNDSTTNSFKKCYAIKRIAFLVFCCQEYEFQHLFADLRDKMIKEVKNVQTKDHKPRLYLLFLTRVLLVQLSKDPQNLSEVLKRLWPHLLNELINIFEVKNDQSEDNVEYNDLIIEAIQFVQLLASLNVEEFQMSQWIFVVDGYGMEQVLKEVQTMSKHKGIQQQKEDLIQQNQSRNRQSSKTPKNQQLKKFDSASKVVEDSLSQVQDSFKTFIVRFMDKKEYTFYNVGPAKDGRNNDVQNVLEKEANDSKKAYSYSTGSHNLHENFFNKINTSRDSTAFINSYVQGEEERQIPTSYVGTHEDTKKQGAQTLLRSNQTLQEKANELQDLINEKNMIGYKFDLEEAKLKIEVDFITNDNILYNNE